MSLKWLCLPAVCQIENLQVNSVMLSESLMENVHLFDSAGPRVYILPQTPVVLADFIQSPKCICSVMPSNSLSALICPFTKGTYGLLPEATKVSSSNSTWAFNYLINLVWQDRLNSFHWYSSTSERSLNLLRQQFAAKIPIRPFRGS